MSTEDCFHGPNHVIQGCYCVLCGMSTDEIEIITGPLKDKDEQALEDLVIKPNLDAAENKQGSQ